MLKSTIIFVFVIFVISGCATAKFNAYVEKPDKFNPDVKRHFSSDIDIVGNTFGSATRSAFSLYYARPLSGKSGVWFIRTVYTARKWLFVDTLKFIVDGKIYTFSDQSRNHREVGSDLFGDVMITERNTFSVSNKFIAAISTAETIDVRLSGKNYYKERVLSPTDVHNIKWYVGYINKEIIGADNKLH